MSKKRRQVSVASTSETIDFMGDREAIEQVGAALALSELTIQRDRAHQKLQDVTLSRQDYIAACEAYDELEEQWRAALAAYEPFVKEEP